MASSLRGRQDTGKTPGGPGNQTKHVAAGPRRLAGTDLPFSACCWSLPSRDPDRRKPTHPLRTTLLSKRYTLMCCRPMVSLKRSGMRSRRSPRRLGVWKRDTRTCSGNLCRSGSSIVREFFLPEDVGKQESKDGRVTPGKTRSPPVQRHLPRACAAVQVRPPGAVFSQRGSGTASTWTPTTSRGRTERPV